MKPYFLNIIFIILFFNSCQKNKQKEVIFGEGINQFNFLDKEYENIYIYDFENLLNKNEKNTLLNKIKDFERIKNISIVFVSIDDAGVNDNIYIDANNLKEILKGKFHIENLVLFEVCKTKKEVVIVYDEKFILNDTISKNIIENTIIPNFRNNQYSVGIINGVDGILNQFKFE
jgi:uncharacterized protein